MTTVGAVWIDVLPSMRRFGPALTSQTGAAADSAGRSAGRSWGSGFSSAARIGLRGFLAAGAGLGALAGYGLKVAAANEQASISFTTMLGSAQKAQTFLGQLQQFAATTPFEFPELQTAASRLISVGINADKVIPIMTSLGDITSGMGTGAEGVQRATNALQQMSAAGKISAQDFNQLRDAGVPVFDLLAKATGKTTEQLAAMRDAGELGRKELDQLMTALESGKGLERFSGLMDKQSQSLSGMLSTFKDTFGQGLAQAVAPALPMLKGVLSGVTGIMATFFGGLKTFAAGLQGSRTALSGFAAGANTLGLGLRALVQAFREGDVTSDGFVGVMERVGLALRSVAGYVMGTVVPAVLQLARSFQANVLPALRDIGAFLLVQVLPRLASFYVLVNGSVIRALADLGSALFSVIGFLREHQAVVLPLLAGVAAFAGVLKVVQLATAGWAAAVRTVTAVTRIWAAAQAALGAVMALNPFVLIAAALVGLGVALVVAYKKSQTFRSVVQGAWDAVRTAVSRAWNNWIRPAFDAFVAGLKATGQWVQDFWTAHVQPIFSAVGGFISATWQNLIRPAFDAFVAGLKATGQWVQDFWTAHVQPVFSAVGGFISATWRNVIRPVFDFLASGVRGIGTVITWLWQKVFQPAFAAIGKIVHVWWFSLVTPVFGMVKFAIQEWARLIFWLWKSIFKVAFLAIGALVKLWWNGYVKPVFELFKLGIRAVAAIVLWLWQHGVSPVLHAMGSLFMWFWHHAVEPVFNGIRSLIRVAWDRGIHPVFLAVQEGLSRLGHAFAVARDAIGRAWDGLKERVAGPVRFIVDTVYNNGILRVWNAVIGRFGGEKLDPLSFGGGSFHDVRPRSAATRAHPTGGGLQAFARGGLARGWALVGEQGPELVDFQTPGRVYTAGLTRAALDGAGGIGDLLTSGADWVTARMADLGEIALGGLRKAGEFLLDPVRATLSGIGGSRWAAALRGMPERSIDSLLSFLGGKDQAAAAAATGYGSAPAVDRNGIVFPLPRGSYSVGVPLNGYRGHTGQDFPAPIGTPVFAPFSGFFTPRALGNRSYGNMANVVAGALRFIGGHLSAFARGAGMVAAGELIGRVGSTGNSTGPHLHAEFRENGRVIDPRSVLSYDRGGILPPGASLAVNGTGGPEAVLTPRQLAALAGPGLRGTATAGQRREFTTLARFLVGSFAQGIRGSAAQAQAAGQRLAKLTTDAIAGPGLRRAINAGNAAISTLIGRRTGLLGRLTQVQQRLADLHTAAGETSAGVAERFTQAGAITGLQGDPMGIAERLRATIANARQMGANVRQLRQRGLGGGLLRQIVEADPAEGAATAAGLLTATPRQIQQLNRLQSQLGNAAKAAGASAAEVLYGAGVRAAQGLVKGLMSQRAAIEATILRIAESMKSAIRRVLHIRSPSAVFADYGTMISAGLVSGMREGHSDVAAAAADLAQASLSRLPATPAFRLGALPAPGPAATHVRVFIGDRELTDIVRVEVDGRDAAMTNALAYGLG